MEIVGLGVDLVEVERIARMLDDHADQFLERCFTHGEQAYCAERKRAPEHYAARFAAKEAVLKALGTGLNDGIAWTEIEIVRRPDGRPEVALSGRAAEVARGLGVERFFLSLSHTDTHAIASVIAVGE